MATATTIDRAAPPQAGPRAFIARLRHGDEIAHLITLIFAAGILVITSMLVYELWVNSQLSRAKFGWNFLWTSVWDPIFDQFGSLPFIYGTVVSSLVALFIAVPLAVAVAVFVTEMCPKPLRRPISYATELLAAIPSVIYGLWAIFILVPILRVYVEPWLMKYFSWTGLFQGPAYGIGMLAAGVVLAIMIVPIISSITREVLAVVPQPQREAALALGATFDPALIKRLGVIGTAPDIAQARNWYRKAAELGSPAATQQLAKLTTPTQ